MQDTILETMAVWSPLVGAHLPRWALRAQQGGQLDNNYGWMDIQKSNQHENAQVSTSLSLFLFPSLSLIVTVSSIY